MQNDFTLEAKSNEGFKFTFHIEKAETVESETSEMILAGVASTTNIDHDGERMSASSLKSMAEIINKEGVPLRYEHQKNNNAVIGTVFKASVDDRNQLKIETRLNKDHPAAPLLYKALKEGSKYGFSVGGRVKRAVKEFSEQTGKMVKTFYDVLLDEVSVTQRPANYDAWLFAKSIVEKGQNTSEYYKTPLYQEFLFENPQLDYMRAFAKSIPDKSWVKINNSNLEKTMTTEEMKTKEKAQETETETKEKAEESKEETKESEKSFVSVKSFNELQSLVSKGFNSLTTLLAKMTSEETETKEKAQEENGTDESGEREKNMDETETKEKGMDSSEETKEKDMSETEEEKEKSAETETKEKAEETETKESESMKSINAAVSRIDRLNKSMKFSKSEGESKEEDVAEGEAEEEVAKSKKTASIDAFVAVVANTLETMKETFEKSNKTVVGFEKAMIDAIKTDPEIQKEIKSMLREPGFKKSVSMGVPIMRTKDGKSYALAATELGTVEKSEKESSFKSVWGSKFSSQDSQ